MDVAAEERLEAEILALLGFDLNALEFPRTFLLIDRVRQDEEVAEHFADAPGFYRYPNPSTEHRFDLGGVTMEEILSFLKAWPDARRSALHDRIAHLV
jgi:hypothetical protein